MVMTSIDSVSISLNNVTETSGYITFENYFGFMS